jgi:Tfp pilus assembly protein PilF
MEIHSDELSLSEPAPAPKRANEPAFALALEEPRATPAAPPPRAAPSETSYTPPSESMERKQAQQVFEVKEMDVNPRKPFYITVGALGLFALGTVGYFWYQLQPKNNYRLPPPLAKTAAPPPAAAPTPGAPAVAMATPSTGVQAAPAVTVASARGAAPAAAAPVAVPAAARADTRARIAPPGAGTMRPRASRRDSEIKITSAQARTDPVLESAYRAFKADDAARARDNYRQVLHNDPDNRDALLGMAAVEMQARQYDTAAGIYTRLLALDPRDAYAEAALIGLKGEIDPLAAESRLKSMIAAQPEASFLQFTLGNQYAAQGRWAEAQQAYFRAYTGDPEHPDFAFNLAVSLDHLHQSKPALEYYRRALALAAGHSVSFDRTQVGARVSQLAR